MLRRSRSLLAIVAELTGEPGLTAGEACRDPSTAESTLREAERLALRMILATQPQEDRETIRIQLAAVLAQLGAMLAEIHDARLAARSAAVAGVQRCLGRLRTATSVRDLIVQIPVEMNRLGYQRALFSRVSGPLWSARSAFAAGDPQLTNDLVEVGSAVPGRVGREWPETKAVRGRAAVLVKDPQRYPQRHHPSLLSLTGTREYIVAPLVGHGSVIGLLHADQQIETNGVDEFDRQLLSLFAEGAGCVFERVMFRDQLGALRDRLQEQYRSIDDLVDGNLPQHWLEPAGAADPLSPPDGRAGSARAPGPRGGEQPDRHRAVRLGGHSQNACEARPPPRRASR